MQEKIPFAPPRMDEAIIKEVTDTLRSGWITTGPRTKALEKEVEKMTGVEKVLCVNSATAGMELMLRWHGVGVGDEVIVPAYTYCATANVVVHCGAIPVMVDIDATTGLLDLEAVKAALTPNTKAIIPVDLAGLPVDYPALQAIIDGFLSTMPESKPGRILLLADAAHSLGAQLYGKAPALQADATVFSFHAVKNLTTAEGGAICLNLPEPHNNLEVYKQLNIKSLHGQSKDALAKFGKNAWEYDVYEPGYKCNMPDVLAAIGLVEARRYSQDTLIRRLEQCHYYNTLLANYPWAELPVVEDDFRTSSAHLYLLRIKGIKAETRNRIIQSIFDEGVSVNVHYKPLPMLHYYKERGYSMKHFPKAQDFFEREITLPIFYDLSKAQQERVVEVVANAVEAELNVNVASS